MEYFFLTLDTTPPQINIYAPTYTNRLTTDEIRVEASEPLEEFQNFYIIDCEGKKHNLIFTQESDTVYTGQLTFSGYPYGIATIFAQVKDTVDNPSRLATANINVIPVFNSYSLNMNLTEAVMGVNFSEESKVLNLSEQVRGVNASEKDMTSLQLSFKLNDQNRTNMAVSDNPLINVNINDADA